ncbi:hypothetical protein ABT247_31690 [Kitasatospora sp. NPDC001539]|uniref:hypothetical protein n=1 Tax=Kitasatospora sp. NPDC001539 TaxID=3154384 RepID=UPI00332F35C1
MPSKRLVSTAVICLLLGAGTAACGDNKDSDKAAAPATTAAAAATPTATPTPTPTVAKLDTDKLSAQEIKKQAKDALTGASAVKLAGTMVDQDGTMEINLAMDSKGRCTGSMSVPGMGKVEVLRDGTASYMKPDAAFWTAIGGQNGAKAAELFKGRYLTGFDNDPEMKPFTSLCDLSEFSKQIVEGGDTAATSVEKGSAGTTNGVKTFSLKVTNAQGEHGTIDVATEGKPYPLHIETAPGKDGQTKIDLSDFDKPLTVQAPPADNTIDFSKFKDQVKTA